MNDEARPVGKRFSLVYMGQGKPLPDSNTMRFRLAKLIERDENRERLRRENPYNRKVSYSYSDEKLRTAIEEELGIPVAVNIDGIVYKSWRSLYKRMSIHHVLDSVSVLSNVMCGFGRGGTFINDVRRVFQEENLAFEFDDLGGAHPVIDTAYRMNAIATLQGLEDPKYTASKIDVDKIDSYLMATPPDYRQAVRNIFSALENVFKMMYSDTHQLNAKFAKDRLGKEVQTLYATQETVNIASQKNISAFAEWINSAHFYRHEQGKPEPNQPTEELAILMISEGLAFLRWLIAIDQKRT
jgi:hypothetical protein